MKIKRNVPLNKFNFYNAKYKIYIYILLIFKKLWKHTPKIRTPLEGKLLVFAYNL